MKSLFILLVLVFTLVNTSFAQMQLNYKNNYSIPIQIDSTDIYFIGSLADKTNKAKYSMGYNANYNNPNLGFWTNILVYNSKTEEVKKLFADSLVMIYPFYSGLTERNVFDYSYTKMVRGSMVYENFLLISVKTDNYSKDGVIDDEDPLSIFICTKDGKKLTQVTPNEMNVLSLKVSRDMKTIFMNVQRDKDGDKKFSNENEEIFKVTIGKDVSKFELKKLEL